MYTPPKSTCSTIHTRGRKLAVGKRGRPYLSNNAEHDKKTPEGGLVLALGVPARIDAPYFSCGNLCRSSNGPKYHGCSSRVATQCAKTTWKTVNLPVEISTGMNSALSLVVNKGS